MTIYISGKMTGVEDYNRPAFFEAEKKLKADGWRVINPAKIGVLPEYEMYLPINKAMLDGCDAIFMLPGWEDSKGAVLEYCYARLNGLEVRVG